LTSVVATKCNFVIGGMKTVSQVTEDTSRPCYSVARKRVRGRIKYQFPLS